MTKNIGEIRILIVNYQSINSPNSSGITLSTLLNGVLKENILEICLTTPSTENIDINYHIAPESINPLKYFFNNILKGRNATEIFNRSLKKNVTSNKTKIVGLKKKLKEIIRSYLDASPIFFDKKTLNIAQNFNPDIIYTLGSSIETMRMAIKLSNKCKCPILLHYMDNWRESIYLGSIMTIPRMILHKLINKIEKKSKAGLVISKRMAEEFSRYGKIKFYPLMNSIDKRKIQTPTLNRNKSLKMVYIGGLHLNRHEPLFDIEKCVRELRNDGLIIKVEIYSHEKDYYLGTMFDNEIIEFKGSLDHNKIYEVFKNADILLHMESFRSEDILFTKYSLSTKISEYLSSGKPILCYAPKEIAVHQYINETSSGFACSNIKELKNKLTTLINDPEKRFSMAKKGVETAQAHHTFEQSRNTLFRAIIENIGDNNA